MKKHLLAAIATASTLCAIAPVHAQEAAPKLYAEIGYTQLNYKENTPGMPLTAKFSSAAVSGILGYQIIPNLAVEGMVGMGLGQGDVKLAFAGVSIPNEGKAKFKSTYGVFVKPSFALNEAVDLFARVGMVHHEIELRVPGDSAKFKDSGFAYGFGANFNFTKTSYLQGNWMQYYKDKGIKVDGFTIAYGMRF